MSTKDNSFIGRKAIFLNMKEDGLKQRSATYKNKKAYDRKNTTWKKEI